MPANLFTFDEKGNLSGNLRLERILGGWNVIVDVMTKPIALSPVLRAWKKIYGDEDAFVSKKQVVGPVKVNYMVNKDYIEKYSSVLKNENFGTKSLFFTEDIGYEKADDWSYENEYRFWMRYPYMKSLHGDVESLRGNIQYIESNFIDVYFNEKAIRDMEIMLAPNFNAGLIEPFKSNLEKLGFMKALQKSMLDVRI